MRLPPPGFTDHACRQVSGQWVAALPRRVLIAQRIGLAVRLLGARHRPLNPDLLVSGGFGHDA